VRRGGDCPIGGGALLCLNPENGTVLTGYNVGAPVVSQPVVWSGYVLLATRTGQLVAFNTGHPELAGCPQWGASPSRNGSPGSSAGDARRGS